MMRADTDPDVFLSEVFQLRDELNDLGKVVSTERFTTIVLDALPTEKYLTIKIQAIMTVLMRTKFYPKTLILPKICPSRFCFTFYG